MNEVRWRAVTVLAVPAGATAQMATADILVPTDAAGPRPRTSRRAPAGRR